MNKRLQNKQQNDAAIMQAAITLFAHKGMETTTIGDIVATSGLARGTFYNYYKSKAEIWDKLVNQLVTRVNDTLKTQRQGAKTAYEFVYDAFIGYAQVLLQPLVLPLIIKNQAAFRNSLFASNSLSSIYKDLENDLKNAPFFQNLVPQQYRMISYAMVGSGLEVMIQLFGQNEELTVEEAGRFFTELFLGGIANLRNGEKLNYHS
ncbi:TetR/AcrR family transcriptional regulator [uncultured Microscilla sp.]|uniref:TetR/AcrR family transcriptional regulator n=1 Tax=uncultured Microscilla sp. TaxID=432653 RepID=UPI00262F17DE|nr:TetR/AcrR family transcriptional regulator [uncultured Microscilla sp.]